jgi:hypothetical protein
VAHSNGACIALLAAQRLIRRGHKIAGLIITSAACEADLSRNGILDWYADGRLDTAIAYSSRDDRVVSGDPRVAQGPLAKVRDWLWGRAMWPYGCLGRTGWLWRGAPWIQRAEDPVPILTRWRPGGHTACFKPDALPDTFEQFYADLSNPLARNAGLLPAAPRQPNAAL